MEKFRYRPVENSEQMIVPWGLAGPGIKKGAVLTEPSNTINTAVTVLHLFKVKVKPLPWIGEVPLSLFQ